MQTPIASGYIGILPSGQPANAPHSGLSVFHDRRRCIAYWKTVPGVSVQLVHLVAAPAKRVR